MRFAIETTTTRGPLTGVGHYVHRLSEALVPLLDHDEQLIAFDGLSCKPIDQALLSATEAQNERMGDVGNQSSAKRTKYNAFLSLRGSSSLRFAMRYLKQKTFQANEHKFDVFHAVQMIPPGPFKKPVLPVIHDLSHIRFPEAHPVERVRWLDKRLKLVLNHVPFIQTVSEFSKQEIVNLLGIPENVIHVSYPGIAPAMSAVRARDAPTGRLSKYGVTAGRYFLMVSTREPRKNFKVPTEAYASLPEAIRRDYPLLWIGHRGWGNLDLSPAVHREVEAGHIRMAGYVPDSDMPDLYRHASLFMMSSLYEGFGMPVTEALSSGAVIAISDIPVFREVAGAFARYVDPMDIDGWRSAMAQAADGSKPERDAVALAQWLGRYSWTGNAAQTLDLYRRLACGAN